MLRLTVRIRHTGSVPDSTRSGRRIGARSLTAAIFVLIPAIPIVIALLLSSGGAAATTAATGAPFTPASAVPASGAPAPTASVAAGAAPRQRMLLPPGRGALVALVRRGTEMRSSPSGSVFTTVTTKTGFGSPQAFWVVRVSGRWLGVVSPQAGNNLLGWISASSATLTRVDWELKVSLSRRQLSVLRNGNLVQRYEVAIGKPSAPTPTGRFAVTDRLNTGNPSGPYGCCILALSAKAPHAIQDWSGGNRIAIHSSPDTSTIGEAISHGCVHVSLAEGQWLLDHIPIGTPTLISS
jgi:lipoprotein-anchoring transpeptidase ErfK/SrfK